MKNKLREREREVTILCEKLSRMEEKMLNL